MGPCAASVETDGALIARISGGGETLSVIPISNATNLNGVGAGMVGWQQVGTDTAETSSTTTVINATTHAARVGDILNFTAGTAGNIGVWSVVSAVATNTITLANALPATPANGDAFSIMRPQPFYLQREDESSFTGALGVLGIGYTNEGQTTLNSVDGDWAGVAYTRRGNAMSTIVYDPGIGAAAAAANQAISKEDIAFPADGALVMAGAQAVSAIAQTVGLTGDVAPPSMDLGNRLVTTNAPAGETWWSCTGEITTATNTQLKASVASNRHYITSFGCAATSTNPNQIYLTDGSGGAAMDLVTTTSNAVAPSVQNTYPVPLRGSSATAVFVTTITTGAVRCCAAGYISTI